MSNVNQGFVRDAAKIGGYFECQVRKSGGGKVCGKRIHIPEDAAAASQMIQDYLDKGGYPAHCDVTMTWVTAFEARHGKKALRQQLFDPSAPQDGGGVEGRDGTVSGEE
jgi:hypothetical protein